MSGPIASTCGARRLPHREHLMRRAARRIGLGILRLEGIVERGVDIHRQRQLRLAHHRHRIDIACDRPGVELFVGVGAEHLAPGAGMHAHPPHDVGGHGRSECLVGGRRMVADGAIGAGLILDLDHDHLVIGIGGLKVRHQPREGGAVGVERRRRERRERVDALPLLVDHPREALVVELDPGRRVAGRGVLPSAEPEQHEMNLMRAGLGEQLVEKGKVELAFLGLDLLPGDRHFERVGVELRDRRPDLGQHGGPGAAVVDLRAEHQIGRARRRAAHGGRDRRRSAAVGLPAPAPWCTAPHQLHPPKPLSSSRPHSCWSPSLAMVAFW